MSQNETEVTIEEQARQEVRRRLLGEFNHFSKWSAAATSAAMNATYVDEHAIRIRLQETAHRTHLMAVMFRQAWNNIGIVLCLALVGCLNGRVSDRPTDSPTIPPSCREIGTHVDALYRRAGVINGARARSLAELAGLCEGGELSLDQLRCVLAASSLEGLALCDGFQLQPVVPHEMEPRGNLEPQDDLGVAVFTDRSWRRTWRRLGRCRVGQCLRHSDRQDGEDDGCKHSGDDAVAVVHGLSYQGSDR